MPSRPPKKLRGNQVGRVEARAEAEKLYRRPVDPTSPPGIASDFPQVDPAQVRQQAEQRAQQRAQQSAQRGNQVGRPATQTSSDMSGGVSREAEARMLSRVQTPSQPISQPPSQPPAQPPAANNPVRVGTPPNSYGQGFGDPIPLRTQQEFTPDPNAIQLRLDLGAANAPISMEQLRQRRQDIRASRGGDRIAGMMRLPDGTEVVHQTYNTQIPRSEWVDTPSGPMLVDTDKLRTVYKAGNQVRSGLIEQSALPTVEPRQGILDNVKSGLRTGFNVFTGIEPGDNTHFSHSVFQLLNPEFRQRYNDALDANNLNLVGKTAAAVGAIGGDMAKFGTISRLLWRSNAMDLMDTYGVPLAATAAGADPTDKPTFKRYAIPLALGAGLVTHVASGNFNPFKIFNTDEGPRVDGYKAEYSDYDTPTQTNNYLLALYNQALPGGGARLLPWGQFHQERPDVTYDQYQNYQNYLWGERGFQLLGGGIKATNESIDAPENAWAIDPRRYEVRAGGYRITPIGLAAGLGALALGGTLIRKKVRAQRMAELMKQGLNEQQAATAIAHQHRPQYKVPENIELL